MPRPVKPRIVENMPQVNFYKPAGVPMMDLKEVVLSIDEFEALRLKDMEKLEQHSCAEKMGVAQSTFQRIITMARQKVVTCLVEGNALRIEGGEYDLATDYVCRRCNRKRHRHKGIHQGVKPEKNNTDNHKPPECPECDSS